MTPTEQTRARLLAHCDEPDVYDPPAMAAVLKLVRELEAQSNIFRNLLSDAQRMVNAAFGAGMEEREFGSASRQRRLSDQYESWLRNIRAALQEDGE